MNTIKRVYKMYNVSSHILLFINNSSECRINTKISPRTTGTTLLRLLFHYLYIFKICRCRMTCSTIPLYLYQYNSFIKSLPELRILKGLDQVSWRISLPYVLVLAVSCSQYNTKWLYETRAQLRIDLSQRASLLFIQSECYWHDSHSKCTCQAFRFCCSKSQNN